MSVAHAFYILYSFRVSANGRFLFRRASPATCSPPLGCSNGGSAELVHARRKVWRARKLARLPCNWLYSQPSFAAPTINWSWRGSRSARLGVLYLRRSLLECRDTYGGLFYARQAYSASRPDMLTQMFANILFQAVLPAFWCCTIKVDIGNSKGQYIEKDEQEATKDGSESTKIQHGI